MTSLQQRQAWVAASLQRMERIKPGMTRGDFLNVFRREGAVYPRDLSSGHFVFDECPYIKVDAAFQLVGATPSNADIVKSISQPCLQRQIFD